MGNEEILEKLRERISDFRDPVIFTEKYDFDDYLVADAVGYKGIYDWFFCCGYSWEFVPDLQAFKLHLPPKENIKGEDYFLLYVNKDTIEYIVEDGMSKNVVVLDDWNYYIMSCIRTYILKEEKENGKKL